MSANDPRVRQLVDMGFEVSRAIEAVKINGYVEASIAWLYKHQPAQFPEGRKLGSEPGAPPEEVPQSLVEEPQIPQEKQKTLTPEEKEEALKRLNERLQKLREEKAVQTEISQLDREKMRREEGKKAQENLELWKQKKEEAELLKIKREREREAEYARQLKEKIRLEKLARQAKLDQSQAPVQTPVQPPATQAAPAKQITANTYTECQVQVRLTNGQIIKASLSPSDTIGTLVNYIEKNRTDGTKPFLVMTTYPKKVFGPETMNQTLTEAGLVPRGVVVISHT